MSEISVVLPVFKNDVLVEYCLTSLEKWLPANSELIVIDDASGVGTENVIRNHKYSKLIIHDANRGNTASYNTGGDAATGEIIFFIDSDVIVIDDCFTKVKQLFDENPDVGVIGSTLIYPMNKTIQHAGVGFDKWSFTHIYTGRKLSDFNFEHLEDKQAVTAAFFACRRSVFTAVQGFDETYRDGFEDIDFCLKAKELGYRIAISNQFVAYHIESATRGPYKQIRRGYNCTIFFSRWHDKYKIDLWDLALKNLKEDFFTANILDQGVTTINFCNLPNWQDAEKLILRRNIQVSSSHNLSGFTNENEAIDLFRQLPITFQKIPQPLLFIVDHFGQLSQNNFWFTQRPVQDLIIDRHANLIYSNYWS